MLGHQLTERLSEAFRERGTASSLVMVIDRANGHIFTIKNIRSEVHDDADGSTTHWIEVEEY